MRIVYEANHIPEIRKYKNVIVEDSEGGYQYEYDSEGTYVRLLKFGPTGPQGATGALGFTGATGAGSTGARGFTGATGPVGFTGPIGAAGGSTVFRGGWINGTAYVKNDNVTNNGSSYSATTAHTAGNPTEPGVGVNWQTVWQLSAIAGSQGVTGPTGVQGIQGPSGPSGPTGPTGPVGFTGAGVTGATGAVGNTGTQGFTGVTGFTGPQGVQGIQGATGPIGATGVTGFTGAGVTGATGPQGVTGPRGFTGPQGPVGAAGGSTVFTGQWVTGTAYSAYDSVVNNGSSYSAIANHTAGAGTEPGVGGSWQTVWQLAAQKGDTGSTGAQGFTGPQGTTGPQGVQGFTGAQGASGVQGLVGANGSTGPQGPTGPQGATGAVGATGVGDVTLSGNQRLTNKRIDPRTISSAGGDIEPNISSRDLYIRTALDAYTVISNPTGSPDRGNKLMLSIKDNGTARVLAWGSQYRGVGVSLPTTTVANKVMYIGAIYNEADTKWDVIAVAQEA